MLVRAYLCHVGSFNVAWAYVPAGGGDLVGKSCPTLATPWTVACQAPLSMGFPRQEYGSGLPFPSPGDLPNPGIERVSSGSAGGFFTMEPPGKHNNAIHKLLESVYLS